MPTQAWKGKNAVICGASAGLGKALAQQLCEQSVAQLLLLARNAERLQAVAAELKAAYPHVSLTSQAVDLSDAEQVQAIAERIAVEFPPADLIIQAVGQSDRGGLQDLSKQRLLELIDANLLTSLHAVQHLTPLMRQPGSSLVLIGSLASHFAPRFLGGYAIVKHALAGLAQQSRLELAERGIHVMLASPGPIAREDAGRRYNEQATAAPIPADALKPGGGAKLSGLDPVRLSQDILAAAARRKPLAIYPPKARLLHILAAIAPRLGDRILRKNSS